MLERDKNEAKIKEKENRIKEIETNLATTSSNLNG